MNFLDEAKAFMSKVVSGTPDERVKSLIGNTFEPDHQKAASHLVNLLHPLGAMDGKDAARAAKAGKSAKNCSLDTVCTAAENFDEIYNQLSPCCSGLDEDCTPEQVDALRQQMKEHWKGRYDDEIDVVMVYYLVNEKGLHPEKARSLVGLADMTDWERYV